MRLQRIGRKNDASFRVVVTDSRNAAKRGKNVELLGSYNPRTDTFQVDAEKAKYWIAHGVQVSDTVHNLLVSEKIIEGKKKNVLPKKAPIIDEAKVKAEAEAKAAQEAAEKAAAEAPAPEATDSTTEETSTEETAPEPTPTEEVQTETTPEETPAEEKTEA